MLVASDDPRVDRRIWQDAGPEGRAQEAAKFLTRASTLRPNDWSYYSALGVAYDQLGNQARRDGL